MAGRPQAPLLGCVNPALPLCQGPIPGPRLPGTTVVCYFQLWGCVFFSGAFGEHTNTLLGVPQDTSGVIIPRCLVNKLVLFLPLWQILPVTVWLKPRSRSHNPVNHRQPGPRSCTSAPRPIIERPGDAPEGAYFGRILSDSLQIAGLRERTGPLTTPGAFG